MQYLFVEKYSKIIPTRARQHCKFWNDNRQRTIHFSCSAAICNIIWYKNHYPSFLPYLHLHLSHLSNSNSHITKKCVVTNNQNEKTKAIVLENEKKHRISKTLSLDGSVLSFPNWNQPTKFEVQTSTRLPKKTHFIIEWQF